MNPFARSSGSTALQPTEVHKAVRGPRIRSAGASSAKCAARARLVGIAALCAGLAAPGIALALPYVYAATGHSNSESGCIPYDMQQQSTGPVTVQHHCTMDRGGSGLSNSWAGAQADYGLLRASSRGVVERVDPLLSGLVVTGGSTARFSGLYTFYGPGSTVDTRLNLDLDGRIGLTPADGRSDSAEFRLDVQAVLYMAERAELNLRQSTGSLDISLSIENWPYALLDPDADWASLAGPNGAHLDLETRSFTVPTGKPILIEVEMYTGFRIGGAGAADLDFGSTLSFDKDGPVFTLPTGYTVNGPGIVDNRWVGADAPAPAVPAPGTALLATLGLGLLGLRRRSG